LKISFAAIFAAGSWSLRARGYSPVVFSGFQVKIFHGILFIIYVDCFNKVIFSERFVVNVKAITSISWLIDIGPKFLGGKNKKDGSNDYSG
jgi:hypothetical protein